ncbi:hypothetical protein OO009_01320 [Flavobacteriaceae bacterium KMM 6897]|nr:hypothetical protein [Flavobacteriaceae bacterium KMM 6897]
MPYTIPLATLEMIKFKFIVISLVTIVTSTGFQANDNLDYKEYHKQITEAEKLLSEEQFADALIRYEQIFTLYDFVFLRDYMVASQLSLYLDDKTKAFKYLKEDIKAGWELKDLKKNEFLKVLQREPKWITIEQSYGNLRSQYGKSIDRDLRDKVRLMFKKDQKKAMGVLFRIGNKAQERYGTKKFAPHSENQMFKLIEILNNHGYPGEKTIGNDILMSTLLVTTILYP